MSEGFSNLGLAKRAFAVSKECSKLAKDIETSSSEEKEKAKNNLTKQVQKEIQEYEASWNSADVYDDYEVKSYNKRMRKELISWARNHINTASLTLENLW